MSDNPARISPTAHYTAMTWYRSGWSHPAFVTPLGHALHAVAAPVNAAWRWRHAQTDLDAMLRARHLALDTLLEQALDSGEVGQVVEIAAGLSPRGWRFCARHPELRYVEADLPAMAARKREVLDKHGLSSPNHRVVALDARLDEGPGSLSALAEQHLDPDKGVAVITEGLLSYLPKEAVEGLWTRTARLGARFPVGLYLSSVHTEAESGTVGAARWFRQVLAVFSRGAVSLHFPDANATAEALQEAGFASSSVHWPTEVLDGPDAPPRPGSQFLRIIEARCAPSAR